MHPIIPAEKILIVDDAPNQVAGLKMILELHGYDVQTVSKGVKALHQILDDPPDLVLLDIMMPEIDGFEVCKFIKNYENTEDIPVIFISACDDPEIIMMAFAMGGDDYITKPLQIDEAIARINTHIIKRLRKIEMEDQIDDLKSYSSMVAHDIKSPIALMQGFAEQLDYNWDEYSDDEKRNFLKAIRRNATKANVIIEELLAFSSIRQTEISTEPLNMDEIFDNIESRVLTWWKQYTGVIHRPAEWPIVMGYAPWIEEVWVNYLSNAIKYGGNDLDIEVGFNLIECDYVQFWVKDQGAGLSASDQEIVFSKHTRIKGVKQEGHGLGLAIVKRILDKLNGYVGVESEPNDGCLFYFALPLAEIPVEEEPAKVPQIS